MTAESSVPEVWGVEYGVSDISSAVDFYVAALGFAEESSDANVAVLSNASSRLVLRKSRAPLGKDGAARVFLNLRVGDLEKTTRVCEQAGGSVPDPAPREIAIGRSVRVHDPSGNPLHLIDHAYAPLGPEEDPAIYNVSVYQMEIAPAEDFYTELGFRVFTRDYLPETLVFDRPGISMVLHRWADGPAEEGARHGALLVHRPGERGPDRDRRDPAGVLVRFLAPPARDGAGLLVEGRS